MYTNKGRRQSDIVQMPYFPNDVNNGKPTLKTRGKLYHFKGIQNKSIQRINNSKIG